MSIVLSDLQVLQLLEQLIQMQWNYNEGDGEWLFQICCLTHHFQPNDRVMLVSWTICTLCRLGTLWSHLTRAGDMTNMIPSQEQCHHYRSQQVDLLVQCSMCTTSGCCCPLHSEAAVIVIHPIHAKCECSTNPHSDNDVWLMCVWELVWIVSSLVIGHGIQDKYTIVFWVFPFMSHSPDPYFLFHVFSFLLRPFHWQDCLHSDANLFLDSSGEFAYLLGLSF